jgi:hypothetical protein
VVYLSILGYFEMYNLQVASNEFQVLKKYAVNVIYYSFGLFTDSCFSPELPTQPPSDFSFYCVVFTDFLWRLFYVRLASNRFLQNAVLICEQAQVEELILGLKVLIRIIESLAM